MIRACLEREAVYVCVREARLKPGVCVISSPGGAPYLSYPWANRSRCYLQSLFPLLIKSFSLHRSRTGFFKAWCSSCFKSQLEHLHRWLPPQLAHTYTETFCLLTPQKEICLSRAFEVLIVKIRPQAGGSEIGSYSVNPGNGHVAAMLLTWERGESRHSCLFIAPRTSSYVHTPLASSTQNITIRLPKYCERTHR